MTETIREQILAIRDTGLTNMFDIPMVQRLAFDRDFHELVCYLEEHRKEYVHFHHVRRSVIPAAKRAGWLFWSYSTQESSAIFVQYIPDN